MKKICRRILYCFLVLNIFFLGNTITVNADRSDPIKQFKTSVVPNVGGKTTNVQLSFVIPDYLVDLSVVVTFEKDNQRVTEHPYATNKDPGSSVFKEQFIDNEYHYYLSFNVTSGKIGDFEVTLIYQLENEQRYEQNFYVYTGNANVSDLFFTKRSALFIGIIASLASAIATYFAVAATEKKPISGEDEDNE